MTVTEGYYSFLRDEIRPLLPPVRGARVLEIGCGTGETAAWLKANGVGGFVLGLEIEPRVAEEARRKLDEVIVGNAETVDFGERRFDLILCLDVLEHMVDPWGFLERVQKHLDAGGTVIASIPNLRNYRVLKSLVLKGRFDYQDGGILDRTHLRFFTRSSACRLMETGGLRLRAVIGKMMRKRKYRWIDRLTFGRIHDFFVYQFLIASTVDLPPVGEKGR